MTKKELEEQLMEMPKLETQGDLVDTEYQRGWNDAKEWLEEQDQIGSVDINQDRPDELVEVHHELRLSSSMIYKDRFCLGGENEEGEYLTIWFDSYEFLKSVNLKKLKEIKAKLIKHIKTK